MGRNIHAHIEVRRDDRWLHYANPIVDRNYTLFDAMLALSKPVEINETSEVTRECYEYDGTMYRVKQLSAIDAELLRELQDKLYEMFPAVKKTGIDELDLEYSIFRTYVGDNALCSHYGWDGLRIVFWFDE